MFKLEINGAYHGSFSTAADAIAKGMDAAKKYLQSWKVIDGYGKVIAQG